MEEEEEERRSEEEEDHWNEPPWDEAPWINEELIRGGLDEWAVHDAEYRWHVGAQESSSSSEDEEEVEEIGFDGSLPTTHSYLGDGMEELHGRTIHDAKDIITLPLLLLPGVTLVPGQVIPLHLFHPQSVSMMKKVLQADKTFGLLNYHRPSTDQDRASWPRSHMTGSQTSDVGTTAEIFSVKEEEEYGVLNLIMKAEGRQRFRVLDVKRQIDGVLMGKVRILEDSNIPPIPSDGFLCNYKRKPNQLNSRVARENWHAINTRFGTGKRLFHDQFPKRCRKTARTSLSAFPYWVYRQYNPYELMDLIMDELRNWSKNLETKMVPTDPNDFSHWLTSNLPLDDTLRLTLLEIDCPITRLKRQLDLMRKCVKLQCCECGNPIADKTELFSMSQKGPLAAYVNPGGYVHETVTFYKAKGLYLRGSASSENSWFPGYAWTIAECGACSHHMGWKFTACKKGLKPSKFWGLTRASLSPRLSS